MEIKLTKNFTLDEMCKSRDARKLRIKNVPSPKEVARLKALCENVLQPLRDYLGEPVIINSGYRCPALNMAVNGRTSSQHLRGMAADINVKGSIKYARKIIAYILENLVFDQLILERQGSAIWVHVSYSPKKNRMEYKEIKVK